MNNDLLVLICLVSAAVASLAGSFYFLHQLVEGTRRTNATLERIVAVLEKNAGRTTA